MKYTTLIGFGITGLLWGCSSPVTTNEEFSIHIASASHHNEICTVIDELVFDRGDATNQPVYSPGVTDDTAAYRQRFERCRKAYHKLTQMKNAAFPELLQHFADTRQSINFENHIMENSVGYACYLIITNQLQDRPGDYSEYGYQRKGRDGRNHPKPRYGNETPFDEAGGLKPWLAKNKDLPYPRMQVRCLQWLLAKEKAIGACDAESYFLNILPLEIRILERRKEAGDDVDLELERFRKILADKDVQAIPPQLLPRTNFRN